MYLSIISLCTLKRDRYFLNRIIYFLVNMFNTFYRTLQHQSFCLIKYSSLIWLWPTFAIPFLELLITSSRFCCIKKGGKYFNCTISFCILKLVLFCEIGWMRAISVKYNFTTFIFKKYVCLPPLLPRKITDKKITKRTNVEFTPMNTRRTTRRYFKPYRMNIIRFEQENYL